MEEMLTVAYVFVDDFVQNVAVPFGRQSCLLPAVRKHTREPELSLSELMTILVCFQMSTQRHLKGFYKQLLDYHRKEFPNLPSYNRFIELQKRAILPLTLLCTCLRGEKTGRYFIDSSALPVCRPKRARWHKVFVDLAKWGKSSMGWFYGLKLHLVINHKADIISFCLTPGNTDDRKTVEKLTKDLFGKIVGDKGYISQELFERLFGRGLGLFTERKKNMRHQIVPQEESDGFNRRSIIETVLNVLKNVHHICHSRHRSLHNFVVNTLGSICGYALKRSIKSGDDLVIARLPR